jgi:hypothetical protein
MAIKMNVARATGPGVLGCVMAEHPLGSKFRNGVTGQN